MISVAEAVQRILQHTPTLSAETADLLLADGRVLAEDIHSTEDLPPFDNSSMDGFAVRTADVMSATADAPAALRIALDIPAGVVASAPIQPGEAARIMTGAPLPEGADAIVPVEDTDAVWDAAQAVGTLVRVRKPAPHGAYIRRRGENIAHGERVIPAGTILRAADIGMLASLGVAHVRVVRQPHVAILTSGDELVRHDETPQPGQIRNGNSPALAVLVRECGAIATIIPHAKDTLADMHRMLDQALAVMPDLLLSTAGVSVGAADFTRDVLRARGHLDFWKIDLRPGRPLAFGSIAGIPFYGLPGNPVSALVTFEILVRPALLRMAGRPHQPRYRQARAAHDITSDGRESYVRVRLEQREDGWHAWETGTQSSGALMSLVRADGLLVIASGVRHVPQGTLSNVYLLREPRKQEVYDHRQPLR